MMGCWSLEQISIGFLALTLLKWSAVMFELQLGGRRRKATGLRAVQIETNGLGSVGFC